MNMLERDESLMAEFPDRNPNPVLALSQTGELLYANPATEHFLQRFGMAAADYSRMLPSDLAQRLADMRQAGVNYMQWEHDYRGRAFACNVVELEEKGICHLYLTDVTERREAEQKVIERTRELEEARNQLPERERLAAIGEFASAIAHEIRSPLSTLTMALDYFNGLADLPEAAQKRAALGCSETARLQRLLDEILLYAKPYSIDAREIKLSRLVSSTLDTIRDMPLSQGREIRVGEVPKGTFLCGDLDKLKQVFLNLLINALEAVPEGEVVEWSFDSDQACTHIRTTVSNGGDPVPADLLEKITQPFVTSKTSGTGLGLAIVKRIVDEHNGRLTIHSSAAQGTVVELCFTCECRI